MAHIFIALLALFATIDYDHIVNADWNLFIGVLMEA